MKKVNMGKVSMLMSILGGIMALIGGVASNIDSKQTAQKTARDTTIEYLDACAKKMGKEA